MKRIVIGALTVLGLAAYANAAQVHFFLASPQATNGAIDGVSASTLGLNPEIPTGAATVQLWMQLNSNEFPQGGTTSLFGGFLDLVGSNASLLGTSTFGSPNPAAPWAPYTAGSAGNVSSGLTFLSTGMNTATASNGSTTTGPLYLIATGTINAGAPGDIRIAIPTGSSIGSNGSLSVGGLAFGWAGGVPNLSATSGGNPQLLMSDVDAAYTPSAGFVGADLGDGSVISSVANLTVVPEPTTIALLCLGGLLARRRK